MGAAESHRHAESLAGPHGDISAEFTGGTQQSERQQIGCDHNKHPGFVRLINKCTIVAHIAIGRRILQQHPAQLLIAEVDSLRAPDM